MSSPPSGPRRSAKALQTFRANNDLHGPVVDVPGLPTKSPVFVDADKNRKQIRTEILSKRVTRWIEEKLPAASVRCRRSEGIVVCNSVPLARVVVYGPESAELQLHLAEAARLKLDRDAALAFFEQASASPLQAVQWG